jgi:DNA polymerase-1
MLEKVRLDGMEKLLFEIEIPLISLLARMERFGFKISPEKMLEFAEALDSLSHELSERIYMQAGREFNINSPKQLGEVLFEEMGLKCSKKKTKTGYSTDAETLEEMRLENPIIEDILEYRQVTKLKGTYAAALPKLCDENHRIHTDFKQTLTATGRLSSAEPNLQNIPIRTKMGREMRRYFIADEGRSLVDADYSQIELRLLAHISDDYHMREAFIAGDDIHTKTASAVFGVPEESVNSEMRKRAKAVNFGIVYGIGGFSLAKDIGTSVKEASDYIKRYMMNYPSIDSYLTEVVERAKEDGYTTTVFGRRRYIPELNMQNGNMKAFGKRVAMNAPIQGTAADIIKLAMLRVDDRLSRDCPEAHLVMQVHDELIVECPDDSVELVKRILKEEMEGVAKLSVPLTVEVTSGKNWLEQE